MPSLSGKVAVVTGSSRSIGAAIARRLAADGANVVVNYVASAAAADAVVESINSAGAGKAISVQADVGNLADGQRLLDTARSTFGTVDILVLNAGIMGAAALQDMTEEFYDSHFTTNVKAPLFLVKAAVPHMNPGGRVIFFSTSLTRNSMITPTYLVYAATKGAVEQMARVLAKDLGARGITVNTVSPGPTDTAMFREGKSSQLIDMIAGTHPLKRLGQPDEISPVVSFLASEEARWVNGHNIFVNGGSMV